MAKTFVRGEPFFEKKFSHYLWSSNELGQSNTPPPIFHASIADLLPERKCEGHPFW